MDGQQNVVFEDVEMLDVEEGEIFAENEVESSDAKRDSDHSEQRKTNGKKKKTRRNKGRSRSRSTPNTTDISRFVPNVCRHLKERKSYLIWAAAACLGASALSDLVKEVDAIQACGGQKTVDGNRFRSGGGILWNILKHREPKAYKEIMNRGKEFEKQFKPQKIHQEPVKNTEPSLRKVTSLLKDLTTDAAPDGSQGDPVQNHVEQSTSNCEVKECKRVSVHHRLRVPVSYDDLVGDE